MPGSCVACHGGTTYNGRFPEQATASPFLGARFLPFDTGNYLFSSQSSLSEAAQSEAFFQLNQLVLATEIDPNSATSRLINGWYANGHVLDKEYVPPIWQLADARAGDGRRGPVLQARWSASPAAPATSSLGAQFDWDDIVLSPARAPATQFCGGTPDVAVNASMPNALISRDRLFERIEGDASLAALVEKFLGCSAPLPDPVYAKR